MKFTVPVGVPAPGATAGAVAVDVVAERIDNGSWKPTEDEIHIIVVSMSEVG